MTERAVQAKAVIFQIQMDCAGFAAIVATAAAHRTHGDVSRSPEELEESQDALIAEIGASVLAHDTAQYADSVARLVEIFAERLNISVP